jgi:type II secretory pathway pseudopilin PulG
VKKRSNSAFSLVEVTLALGIAAFCLIAVFGLIPIAVQTNRNATSQTAATNIMAAVVADLRATPLTTPPGGATTSVQYQIPIPQNPVTVSTTLAPVFFAQDGTFSTTMQPSSRYRLTVTFPPNGPATHSSTYADVRVTWPAPVDPATTTPSGSIEMFAAFDRN